MKTRRRRTDGPVDELRARWGLMKFALGRHAARYPVVAAGLVMTAVLALLLLMVLGSNSDSHRALRQVQGVALHNTKILAEVSQEQALITRYLKQASPAGRERIEIECESVNARFAALGRALEGYRPPPGSPETSQLIKNLRSALQRTDCAKLVSIGPSAGSSLR